MLVYVHGSSHRLGFLVCFRPTDQVTMKYPLLPSMLKLYGIVLHY